MPAHLCDICGRRIPPHADYIVRVEVYADPSIPAMSSEELEDADPGEMARLLEEMKQYSAEELQDQVHRRFEYRICRGCQGRFIANPLGLPREGSMGKN